MIDDDGRCEYCHLQDKLRAQSNPDAWPAMLNKIKRKGKGRKYDCLVGISGGEDSSILLYLAARVWNLRVLAVHFDNRSNRPESNHNIDLITERLGVDFIRYYVNQQEYDALTDAFLIAGVQDADIANDIAMAKLMDTACKQYRIKYILNGHDYRREGSSPAAWSYMDAKYVQSVYECWMKKKLVNYPLYTFWDQVKAGLMGIRQIRPYHYSDHKRKEILDTLKEMGWKDYGGKHNENVYTAFVGNYLLPRKFGIDKRITYLSAQMREGFITREYAESILQERAEFDTKDLGKREKNVLALMRLRKGNRNQYLRYNFKAWKPVIWLLAKMKIVPYTLYFKYCR